MAAVATAIPWLPLLAVTSAAAGLPSATTATLLCAPRVLKAPVGCTSSRFSRTSLAPDSAVSSALGSRGVCSAIPRSRSRAALTSARVGRRGIGRVSHVRGSPKLLPSDANGQLRTYLRLNLAESCPASQLLARWSTDPTRTWPLAPLPGKSRPFQDARSGGGQWLRRRAGCLADVAQSHSDPHQRAQ